MKIPAALFCILLSLQLSAQEGLYVTPHAGVGITNTNREASGFLARFKPELQASTGLSAGIDVGILHKRWAFQSGLGLLRSGYQIKFEVYDGTLGLIGSGSTHTRYTHLLLPLAVGYDFPLRKRLSLRPLLGADLSYNLGEGSKTRYPGYENSGRMHADTFNRHFERVSLFCKGALSFHYDLNSRLGLMAGLSGRYMLTQFVKSESVAPGSTLNLRPWVLTLDAGMSFKMRPKKKCRPAMPSLIQREP